MMLYLTHFAEGYDTPIRANANKSLIRAISLNDYIKDV